MSFYDIKALPVVVNQYILANPSEDKARMQETIKFFQNSNERPLGSSALRIQRLQDTGFKFD